MAKRPQLKLVHGFTPPENVEELALAKLASSGLTREDAKRLGMTWHDATETRQNGFWPLPSLRIPYLRPDGSRTLMRAHPAAPPFYRVRALRDPPQPEKGFSKYLQPKGSGICAYFPALIDWPAHLADPTRPLLVTEGELKAAKATREGHPTIGLGGVNNYAAVRSHGVELLPELEAVPWLWREVTLVYDSDVRSNTNVVRALQALADVLAARGAIVKALFLPEDPDLSKVGLDDYLLTRTSDQLAVELAANSNHLSYVKQLFALNERYAYLPDLQRVVNQRNGKLLSVDAFGLASTLKMREPVLKDNGEISYKPVSATKAWLEWPLRQDVLQLTYDPALEPLTIVPSRAPEATPEESDYNLWTGWATAPAAGDASAFVELVDHLFTGAEPGAKEWFLCWCAYPLQHPGVKLFSSVLVYGLGEGTGKSLLGYTLGAIYGRNFTEISQDNLHGDFNEWAIGKQLVMGDDVTGSDKRQDLDRLKKMITQKEIRINAKNQPTYTLPDCLNYLWTSNHPDAFFLGDQDRRFFIHEVTVPPLPDAFYERYDRLLHKEPAFAAAVFHHLLQVDTSRFNPRAKAFGTEAKRKMTMTTRSDVSNWTHDLRTNPDALLRLGETPVTEDLLTTQRLLALYHAFQGLDARDQVTPGRLGRELAKAGFRQAYGGKLVTVDGTAQRYWIVRDLDRWRDAPLAELQAHLKTGDAPAAPRAKKY